MRLIKGLTISMKMLFAFALIGPALAQSDSLTDYQRGVLDGLGVGWEMAKKHDQALQGRPEEFNLAVPIYNAWIENIFGRNESLMLLPVSSATAGQAARQKDSYFISKTFTPIHSLDASWNQTEISLLPEPDAYGLIDGVPAHAYYSFGPALADF